MRELILYNAKWVQELIRASARTSPEGRFLHRLHCVLLIFENRNCYEVARWFGESPRTIQRWVRAFNNDGMEGLRDHHSSGRRGKLTGEQMRCLAHDLKNSPPVLGYLDQKWGGKLLSEHLASNYGIRLSVRQCQRIIRVFSEEGVEK